MKRLAILAAVLLATASSGVLAEGTDDGKEILKKVDATSKAVMAVSYSGSYKAEGALASRIPTLEGKVMVLGPVEGGVPKKFRIEAKVTAPDSSETKSLVVGSDGENFYLIDRTAKTVYEDIDPAVIGRTGQRVMGLVMQEFLHPTPFSDEINAKSEMKGTAKVGDEECWKIFVDYGTAAGGQTAMWYFCKKDNLPRQVDRTRSSQSGEKTTTFQVVTNLKADPKFKDGAFKVVVPEGYTKSDDFAP